MVNTNYKIEELGNTEVLEKVKEDSATSKEGKVAKAIEKQTTKLPSDLFLWVSVGSMLASFTFRLLKREKLSLFIGQWASPILLLGVYNKLVKLHGSEK